MDVLQAKRQLSVYLCINSLVRRRAMLGDKDLSQFRSSDIVVATAWLQRNKEEKVERRERESAVNAIFTNKEINR